MKKIKYGGGLMKGLVGMPALATCEGVHPLRGRKTTSLREQYVRTRRHYGVERPPVCDTDLKRLFSAVHRMHWIGRHQVAV